MKKYLRLINFYILTFFLFSCAEERKAFYDNGNLKEEGKVKKDNNDNYYKTGTWKYYYKDRQLEKSIEYKNGKKNGKLIEYSEKGVKIREEKYLNDTLNGLSKSWYENKQLKESLTYKNGIKHKDYSSYCENGQILKKGFYKDGIKTGNWEYWYCNGQKKGIEFYNYFKLGLRGRSDFYYENGNKWYSKYEAKKINDTYFRNDTSKTWYYNGNKRSEVKYRNDSIIWEKSWYKNGTLEYEEFYKNRPKFGKNGGLFNAKYYDLNGYLSGSIINGNGEYVEIYKGNFNHNDTSGRKYTCSACEIKKVYNVKNGHYNHNVYTIYTNGLKRYTTENSGKNSWLYNPDNNYSYNSPCKNFTYKIYNQKYYSDGDYTIYSFNCSNSGKTVVITYWNDAQIYENTNRSSQHEAVKKACGCD
ncbi:hypothetical protein [uncultured Tenacibaculum sp.]|uniref:toxin-antitoxin system YwqK family antitoxin n=1 Tax=uncultured Tenacibaculum sp. TaxID=174713 RepID=UPI00262ABCDB|nr:hypothetical protein [uncultured Tenacibaculum sp.]